MSGKVTGWVGQHGPHPDDVDRDGRPYGQRARGLRMVLLAVADAANVNGSHAYPGVENVASFSLYSPGQARRLLTELVAEGWLTVTETGGGRGRATEYTVTMDGNRHLETRASRRGSGPGNARVSDPETRAPATETRASAPQTRASGRAPNGSTTGTTVGNNAAEPRLALIADPPESPAAEDPARSVARAVWEAKDPRPATPFIGVVQIARALLGAGHSPDRVEAAMLAVPTISVRWCESWLNRNRAPQATKVSRARDVAEGRVSL